MEDVLELYAAPYDPKYPLICMDEQPVQLLDDVYEAIPMKQGKPRKEDYEYERKGTCAVFMFTEPLKGWRYVNARERRTSIDWAHEIKRLLDVDYPDAQKIRLVMDNLNTHKLGALYEAFPAEEARRLAKRLEIHYTPKHGSWLNIAEIELSAMTVQCLSRRIPSIEKLNQEISCWKTERNKSTKTVNWQFTTDKARGKLKHLYPRI